MVTGTGGRSPVTRTNERSETVTRGWRVTSRATSSRPGVPGLKAKVFVPWPLTGVPPTPPRVQRNVRSPLCADGTLALTLAVPFATVEFTVIVPARAGEMTATSADALTGVPFVVTTTFSVVVPAVSAVN